MVALPGWLLHAVTPTVGAPERGADLDLDSEREEEEADDAEVEGWRVSFSFTLHGEWRDTAAVLLELELGQD
jgi:hypothetical protein